MDIITAKEKTTLAELARRLFASDPDNAKAVERKAIAALRKANPHLKPNESLPEGAPVLVPQIDGAKRAAGRSKGIEFASKASELKRALATLEDLLQKSWEQREQQEQSAAEDLKLHTREFSPEMKKQVRVVQEAATRRKKEGTEERKQQQQALIRLKKDFQQISKVLPD